MKKTLIIFALLSIIFFLVIKYWDTESNLGDGYFYLPSDVAYDIGFSGGGVVYKSSKKLVFDDIKIHGDVIKAKETGNYIIAIQVLENNVIEKYFIINKTNDSIFKNLNKSQFDFFCMKFNIEQF